MKTLLIILMLLLAVASFGQKYDVTNSLGEYQKDWALVQQNGLLGFIDISENEIIKSVYDDIKNGEPISGIRGNIKEEIKH